MGRWFQTLSGLYPRPRAGDPVPAKLRRLAVVGWFTWCVLWGWMAFDLVGGLPVLEIFAGKEVSLDVDRIEARLPLWLTWQGLHGLGCLAVHAAQVVYGMNLPFHKASVLWPMVRAGRTAPSKPELLAQLLDAEAKAGGFHLATVHAFAQHAVPGDWPTRTRLLQGWVRLQLTALDAALTAGQELVDTPAGPERVTDRSMVLQQTDQLLRRRPAS